MQPTVDSSTTVAVPKDSTNFVYELGVPSLSGVLKREASDFQVKENLKFELNGEGQHLCLLIEKQFLNTQDAVVILAKFFKVSERAIGYFGMKDKVALTQQWFSVDLASSPVDESHCENFNSQFKPIMESTIRLSDSFSKKSASSKMSKTLGYKEFTDKESTDNVGKDKMVKKENLASMRILARSRNRKKFKIGQLAGNSFKIIIRDITSTSTKTGSSARSLDKIQRELEQKLSKIATQGYPNYFGEQRFGRGNKNIELLKKNINADLGKRRALRSRVISTLRSLVFNRYLSERIQEKSARKYKEGDVLQFPNSRSIFTEIAQITDKGSDLSSPDSSSESLNSSATLSKSLESIQARIDSGEVLISGPMLGIDPSKAKDTSLVFEDLIVRKFRTYLPLLEKQKVQSARRALIAKPSNMSWQWLGSDLHLEFDLGSGSFATALIKELVNYRN